MARKKIWSYLGLGYAVLLAGVIYYAAGGFRPRAEDPTSGREQPSSKRPRSFIHIDVKKYENQRPAAVPEHLVSSCGTCHYPPEPQVLTQELWVFALREMARYSEEKGQPISPEKLDDLAAYYLTNSPKALATLPPDPSDPGIRFKAQPFGNSGDNQPLITNLNVTDLDQDGLQDVLICDSRASQVSWCHREGETWKEQTLADADEPVHTSVFDFEGDGDLDIAVAAIGSLGPSDTLAGSVLLLLQRKPLEFETRTLLEQIPRVTDVQPGDLDADGDTDLLVGMYGWRKTGGIAWLEQQGNQKFAFHWITTKNGCIHIPTADLDGDGRLDFVSLFAQEHEQVVVYLNRDAGNFEAKIIYEAKNPSFGSSGIQLVDLDRDGDLDVLYTNGDLIDFIAAGPLPYHGVQWLENLGNLEFTYHDILRFYGVYRAVAGDFDSDGDKDVVMGSMFNLWKDPARQSLVWLENNGKQQFVPHAIANNPTHIPTVEVGDFNGDNRLDVLAGCMPIQESFGRVRRITLWTNLGKVEGGEDLKP